MTFTEEGSDFRVSFDYRDARRVFKDVTFGIHETSHREGVWGAIHNPRMHTDAAVNGGGGDEGE